jgi:hypothetical protein
VNADRLTRWTAVAAVLAVAAVAAVISFRHAVEVVTAHGEPGTVGHLYPVVIDGLIIAASMVLLDAARHREDPPRLAWWMLGAGIGGTLAVNVLAGLAAGWLGAVIASWPALAFVGCYELLMMLVRAAARRAPATLSNPAVKSDPARGEIGQPELTAPDATADASDPVAVRAQLNGHAAKSEKAFAADVAAGRVPGIRRIQQQMHVGQPKARLVQTHLRSLIQ